MSKNWSPEVTSDRFTAASPSGLDPAHELTNSFDPESHCESGEEHLGGPAVSAGALRDALVHQVSLDLGQRETRGPNRSPRIDQINRIAHLPLGSSYCTAGATEAWDAVCKHFGLKNPLGIRGGSQDALHAFPSRYYVLAGHALRGDFAAFTDRGNSAHGHWATLVHDQLHQLPHEFQSIEYNTDSQGSRNGGGVFAKHRVTTAMGSLRFREFLNIVQWTLDHNGIKS